MEDNRQKFIDDLVEGMRASAEVDAAIATTGTPDPTWLSQGQNYLLSESAIFYGKISGMYHAIDILYGRETADEVYRQAADKAVDTALSELDDTFGNAFSAFDAFVDDFAGLMGNLSEVTDEVASPTRPNWLNDETI